LEEETKPFGDHPGKAKPQHQLTFTTGMLSLFKPINGSRQQAISGINELFLLVHTLAS